MNTSKIFCGVCGYASETALFQHIREAHKMTVTDYAAQCPGAPLYTDAFQDYVRKNGVHTEEAETGDQGDGIRVMRELFGVKVSCAVAPQPHVPELDEAYHFDPALAQGVLHSLVG